MIGPTGFAARRGEARHESRALRLLVVAGPLVLVGLVLAAAVAVQRANSERQAVAVTARADAVTTAVADRMAGYTEVLRGITASFSRPTRPTRGEFREAIQRLDVSSRHPGVQVIGAAHLVPRAELTTFEREVEAATSGAGLGYPTFVVHPPTYGPRLLPIDYLEPQVGNEQAFGLDFFSEPRRQGAATLARDTGVPAATAPVTLVQESGTQLAILVMVPVYRTGAAIDTIAARRASFTGVVYAAFRMDDLIHGVLGTDVQDTLAIIDASSRARLFGDLDEVTAAGPSRSLTIEVGGRPWTLTVAVSEPLLAWTERLLPLGILVAGAAIVVMLSALVHSMRRTQARAVSLAAEMTSELHALTEAAGEAIVTIDSAGQVISWNRGATEIFGWERAEVLGRDATIIVPDEAGVSVARTLLQVLAGERDELLGRSLPMAVLHRDTTAFAAEVSLARWTARGVPYLTAFIRDVSEREETLARLRATTETLTAVLEAATEVSVIGTDPDGTIRVFNAGAERMLGYRAEDLVGSSTPALVHDPDEVRARAEELAIEPGFEVFVGAARQGVAETRVWTYVRSDGSRLPVELTVTPMRSEQGALVGFIGIATDVTRRVETERVQAAALEHERELVARLTELDRTKSDFVSNMSHELRTPLTSILGYSELLADEVGASLGPRTGELVEMVERNAQRLLALVEDLLALSSIESGSFRLHPRPCEVERLVQGALAAVAPLAAARGQRIVVQLAAGLVVHADAGHLERAIINILGNAVKFSHDDGAIEVLARAEGSEISISVTDHGIGIPDDEKERVTDRFFRSRRADELGIKGTGLGLAIVTGIVERHGGRMQVDSIEGLGTTMTVWLRAGTSAAPAAVEEEARP